MHRGWASFGDINTEQVIEPSLLMNVNTCSASLPHFLSFLLLQRRPEYPAFLASILGVVNLVRERPLHTLRDNLLQSLRDNRILAILRSMCLAQPSRLRRVTGVVDRVRQDSLHGLRHHLLNWKRHNRILTIVESVCLACNGALRVKLVRLTMLPRLLVD